MPATITTKQAHNSHTTARLLCEVHLYSHCSSSFYFLLRLSLHSQLAQPHSGQETSTATLRNNRRGERAASDTTVSRHASNLCTQMRLIVKNKVDGYATTAARFRQLSAATQHSGKPFQCLLPSTSACVYGVCCTQNMRNTTELKRNTLDWQFPRPRGTAMRNQHTPTDRFGIPSIVGVGSATCSTRR